MTTIVVSSPGEVTPTIRYLALDPDHSGVVVAISSWFYTAVKAAGVRNEASENSQRGMIRVRSSQLPDTTWTYDTSRWLNSVSNITQAKVRQFPSSLGLENHFFNYALAQTLALALRVKDFAHISQVLSSGIDITIARDDDFCSRQDQLQKILGLPSDVSSVVQAHPFYPLGTSLSDISKTSCSPSSALITSFVTALLIHFAILPLDARTAPDSIVNQKVCALAHNLEQFAYSLAQSRAASGLDPVSTIFGSQIYTHFAPEIIKSFTDDPGQRLLLAPTISPDDLAWSNRYRAEPFPLAPRMRLAVVDIHAGLNTPCFVSRVVQESGAEAQALRITLKQLHFSLAATLCHLTSLFASDGPKYTQALKYISSLQSAQWLANPAMERPQLDCLEAFYKVHSLTQQIQDNTCKIEKLCQAKTELKAQRHLLDECLALAGIVGGGLISDRGMWILLCDPEEVTEPDIHPFPRLKMFCEKKLGITPLIPECEYAGFCVEVLRVRDV